MSASITVLDLIRAHYRADEQAFRTFAFRLARMTKVESTRKTMLDVVEKGGRAPGRGGAGRGADPQQLRPMSSNLLEPLAEVSLDDLLLEDDVRAQLDEIVLELAHRDELETRNLRPRCRLLFEGPPGNGKTSSGAAIAHELGVPAYGVSIPSLIGSHLGETGRNLAALFQHVQSGTLVVFDEIDAVGGSRIAVRQSADAEQNASVNAILTLLDRKGDGTLVATTNRADVLDPALRRRFDEVITFPGPTRAQMAQLAGRLEDKFGVTESVDLTGCENFDAVTKRVLRAARAEAMAAILDAKAAADEDLADDGDDDTDRAAS